MKSKWFASLLMMAFAVLVTATRISGQPQLSNFPSCQLPFVARRGLLYPTALHAIYPSKRSSPLIFVEGTSGPLRPTWLARRTLEDNSRMRRQTSPIRSPTRPTLFIVLM